MNKRFSILLTTAGAWGLILAAAIAFFLLGQESEDDEESRNLLQGCSEKLHVLGVALKTYADQNNGAFPGELEELVRNGILSDSHALSCPSKHFHYMYAGESLNVKTVSPEMPVVFDRVNNHSGCVNVLFADFRVRTVSMEKASYSSLTPLLRNLKPAEQKTLKQKFNLLDKIFFLK